jgi:leucyl-tRNA synthetase
MSGDVGRCVMVMDQLCHQKQPLRYLGEIIEKAMRQYGADGKPLSVREFTELVNRHWGDQYAKKSSINRLKNAGRADRKDTSKQIDRHLLTQIAPFTPYTAEELWAMANQRATFYAQQDDAESKSAIKSLCTEKESQGKDMPTLIEMVGTQVQAKGRTEFLRISRLTEAELDSLLTGKPIHQSLAYFLAPVLSLSVDRVLDLIVEANETCHPDQNDLPDQPPGEPTVNGKHP